MSFKLNLIGVCNHLWSKFKSQLEARLANLNRVKLSYALCGSFR